MEIFGFGEMDSSCDVDGFDEDSASLEIVEFNDADILENVATSSISFFMGGRNGKFNAIDDDSAVSIFIIFEVFSAIPDFEI